MKTTLKLFVPFLIATLSLSCKGNRSEAETELEINRKFAPYFSIGNGKYQLDLTQEEAAEIGIDAAHYRPVKATVDTFNRWIEKYHITPEQIESGQPIDICTEEGDTIHFTPFISAKEIEALKGQMETDGK